jgi:hypothetical protein
VANFFGRILLTSDGKVRQERSQKYLQKLLVTLCFPMVLKIPCYPKHSKEDLLQRQMLCARRERFREDRPRRVPAASNLLAGRMQMTRNRAGTYIEHLVDGLAGNMRFAAPSDAVREKDASDIQIGFCY